MGANAKLGLPTRDKMQKVAICFDVDGTLIDDLGRCRYQYMVLLGVMYRVFKNARIVVWSGGGADYAESRARQLGIEQYAWKFMSKLDHKQLRDAGYDIIAIDDIQDTALGNINLIVKQ